MRFDASGAHAPNPLHRVAKSRGIEADPIDQIP